LIDILAARKTNLHNQH